MSKKFRVGAVNPLIGLVELSDLIKGNQVSAYRSYSKIYNTSYETFAFPFSELSSREKVTILKILTTKEGKGFGLDLEVTASGTGNENVNNSILLVGYQVNKELLVKLPEDKKDSDFKGSSYESSENRKDTYGKADITSIVEKIIKEENNAWDPKERYRTLCDQQQKNKEFAESDDPMVGGVGLLTIVREQQNGLRFR